jgi:hypothetical protein
MPRIDITGQAFGRLTVERFDRNHDSNAYWFCRCTCGKTLSVRGQHLRNGKIVSCGCHSREQTSIHRRKHGGADKHPLYVTWLKIRQRCFNPTNPAYPRYGGAGISVCEAWNDFAQFVADVGERPEGKTLDRWPNPAGNYEPGNCRWATHKEQRHNRRT